MNKGIGVSRLCAGLVFWVIGLVSFGLPASVQAAEFAPLKLIDQDNARFVHAGRKPVAEWELPMDEDLLRALGLIRGNRRDITQNQQSIQSLQRMSKLFENQIFLLQGRSPIQFVPTTTTNQTHLSVVRTGDNNYLTFPSNTSGEVTVLGQLIPGGKLVDGSVDLLTKTTGDFLQSIVSGNGISISGTVGQAWTATATLGTLTEDWVQTAPFDIVLNNVESRLKLLDASGNHFAVIDAGSLDEDITFLLSGTGGTLLTSSNYGSFIDDVVADIDNLSGITDPVLARIHLGLGDAATRSASLFLDKAQNLSDLDDALSARDNLGLSDMATAAVTDFLQVSNNLADLDPVSARENLDLGTAALLDSGAFLLSETNLSDLSDPASARTNLDLGTAALLNAGEVLLANNNLSELVDPTAARISLGLTDMALESADNFFQVVNNLSEVNPSLARGNLGLGTAAVLNSTAVLLTSNNLSDINASTARTNLGLGSSATLPSSTFLQAANNLSDVTPSVARSNLSLGSAALLPTSSFLQVANNLSEITDAAAARTSLNLGTSATQSIDHFLQVSNNLSDLPNPATARTNLALGNLAILNTSDVLQPTNNLSELSNSTTARTNLGLGSIATQNSNNVTLTGGTINAVALGGGTPAAAAFTTLNSSGTTTLGSAGNVTIGYGSGTLQLTSSGLNVSTGGALSGITGYTQGSGDFSVSGAGAFSTSTGAVSLRGNTTVSSGKTLAMTSSDSLTVGGVIVPQTITISVPMLATVSVGLTDEVVFVADNSYQVTAVRCVYSAAASVGANLQVTVDTSTAAPGAGTDQLSSSISLASSLNTVLNGTLIATPTTITAGDRVSIDFSGTLLGILGNCTITLKRV